MIDISTLNDAQQKAVTSEARSLLIIAGAGSGKTRTLIYRLAWLLEKGISIQNMLLLTFTKKASQQMLDRASALAGYEMKGMKSGTFHSFAFSVLRQHPHFCLRFTEKKQGHVTVMDSADQNACISLCKDEAKIAKGDRSFPKSSAIISLISKSRNKEFSIADILRRESVHLLHYADDIQSLADLYDEYKKKHGLYDYDDLLFELEAIFQEETEILRYYQDYYRHIMVDEYQDTNKVQARIIKLLAGETGNIMAVGDDAQSIYAFRGATVRNILEFPKDFPDTEIIYLEENYRSYQPILDISNTILENASEGYKKNLFTNIPNDYDDKPVRMYKTLSDLSQAKVAMQYINNLIEENEHSEIVVLFRAGFHAYHLELELNKRNIKYRKVGGIKYTEASHIKDFLSYAKLINNPQDRLSFNRIASFAKGVGTKTAQKLYLLSQSGEIDKFEKTILKYPDFKRDIDFINAIRARQFQENQEDRLSLGELLNHLLEQYKLHVEHLYPEDYPRRMQGLEELLTIALEYTDLDLFISDLILNSTDEEGDLESYKLTLSTVHSAKGLEWEHVLIMDLVEDRFPSRHALAKEEDFEEERRLLYVACTRAKKSLALFVPSSLYQRGHGGFDSAMPSPFLRGIGKNSYDEFQEGIGGICSQNSYDGTKGQKHKEVLEEKLEYREEYQEEILEENYGEYEEKQFCKHKIFGYGEVLEEIDADKYKVNFQNFGIKTILKDFVSFDEDF